MAVRACLLFVCIVLLHNALAQDVREVVLSSHNAARSAASSSVPALVWDDALAAKAQQFADQCPTDHNAEPEYGENLAWGTGDIQSLVDGWLQESNYFDATRNRCAAGRVCGHYTQAVWQNTLRVGCGVRDGCNNVLESSHRSLVCYYDPPGNFIGERPFDVPASTPCVDQWPAGLCGQLTSCDGTTVSRTCESGASCVRGECCVPDRTECAVNECGSVSNGCGRMECGECGAGLACVNHQCVAAAQCEREVVCRDFEGSALECGSISNNCNSVITCGECPTGTSCFNYQCVADCAGGCGVGQYCDRESQQCECEHGFQQVGPRQCAPVPSNGRPHFSEWEVLEGASEWRQDGAQYVATGDKGYNRLLWHYSNTTMDSDSSIAVEFSGLREKESALIGFRYDLETHNFMELKAKRTSSGKADISLCHRIGSKFQCTSTFCDDKRFSSGFTRVEVRSREFDDGLEVSAAVGGEHCSVLLTLPLESRNYHFYDRGHATVGFHLESAHPIAFRGASIVTRNTLSVALNQCLSSEQWIQYLISVLSITRDNIQIVDMGDASACGSRKRAEVLGGVGSAITFQLIGSAAKSSGAMASQFMSATAVGAAEGASVGGAMQGVVVANGGAPGTAGAARGAAASAVGGGGGGGGGGLGVGGIVALSVALPMTLLVLVAMAAVVTIGAYSYSKNGRGETTTSGSVDAEPEHRSLSRRVRGFFVKVMGDGVDTHQSITARSPPVKV